MSVSPTRPVKQATLINVRTVAEAYAQLVQQLEFPADFGYNLDALYDALTGSLEGPLRIVWRDALAAKAAFPLHDFEDLLGVFNDAAGERDDLEIVLT
ncbi:barstar family protein [Amantichitinum ursilacus]|uniref:Barstar n=1 Tax=Amantichitinum ursilacus TaxID=857265 RepID=A0A0N0GNV2_9NEIS|nr:barstar family protein [Amantichitinum ursilacus]KPC52923.1 Barstar [Amantichitinum ursilacus]